MSFLYNNPVVLTAMLVVCAVCLVVSVARDPRRFRNCFWLLGTLVLLDIWIITQFSQTMFGKLAAALTLLVPYFLMMILPFMLIANGVIMIRREGKSFTNLLSMLFGFMMFALDLCLLFKSVHIIGPLPKFLDLLLSLGAAVIMYGSVIFLAFVLYTFFMRLIPHRADFDYIIVLGAGLINGETVSKLLSDRLDKGIKVYERSLSSCKFIVSGGQGPDEKISEAQAMKNYLLSQSIPEQDILLEDRSVNTMENLRNSQQIIESRRGRQLTAVVTSSYHYIRAIIYARRLNFPVTGISAHTAAYYWPTAMIREYAALIRFYLPQFLTGLIAVIAIVIGIITSS